MTLDERSNITAAVVDEHETVMEELWTELDRLKRENAGNSEGGLCQANC